MTGNEFIKRIQRLAKQRDIESRIDLKRGKGSHVTLYLGDKYTIVRNPKDELKSDTLNVCLSKLVLQKWIFDWRWL